MAAVSTATFPAARPQNQWAGTQLNPTLWTVEVRLQNNQFKYLQFNTQQEAQLDIQSHSFGTLIAPGNQPGQANPAAPGAGLVTTKTLGKKTAQGAWSGIGLNPALWTVEIQQGANWVYNQFNTQAAAQANQRSAGGTLIRPNAAATATPNTTPAALPYSNTGWVRVRAGSKTWQFDKGNEAAARRAFAWAQGQNLSPRYEAYNRNPGTQVTRYPQGFNPQGPNYA